LIFLLYVKYSTGEFLKEINATGWLLSNMVFTLGRYYNVVPELQEAAAISFDKLIIHNSISSKT
jgi:hypothetical protein